MHAPDAQAHARRFPASGRREGSPPAASIVDGVRIETAEPRRTDRRTVVAPSSLVANVEGDADDARERGADRSIAVAR